MRILFYSPATTQKRFIPYEAIKGSTLFRRPRYDAMRLSSLSKSHDFFYYDERIEAKPELSPDILVVNVPLKLSRYVESTLHKKWHNRTRTICYGLYPTLFPERSKKFFDTIVIGDIATVWRKLLADIKHNKHCELYQSDETAGFSVDRTIELKYGFTPVLSQLRTSFGCKCIGEQKDYCSENILHKKSVKWNRDRVIEEVSHIKRKIIYILDDDFLYDIDNTVEILEKCWRYKKMWIFQTTSQVFKHSEILPTLRDDGVRIIYLKEDWLGTQLTRDIEKTGFIKNRKDQVSLIHNYKIAVGCKLRLGFPGENYNFYHKLYEFLMNIKVDFIEISTQTPLPKTDMYKRYDKAGFIAKDLTLYDKWMPVVRIPGITPQALYTWMEWLRDSFYSWDSILLRNILVSPKLGFYNTVFFYLIPNLSYRNNFLEKVGYPP